MKQMQPCRAVKVFAFRGDRSPPFASTILTGLIEARNGQNAGPSELECLLFVGHMGVSTDSGVTIYGFHPDHAGQPIWQVLDRLKSGDAFPGLIRDDTQVFTRARSQKLSIESFTILLPDSAFQEFVLRLDGASQNCQYSYGFPDGDGDCNCVTFWERLGLPLLTGRMEEFTNLTGLIGNPSRRFGRCV